MALPLVAIAAGLGISAAKYVVKEAGKQVFKKGGYGKLMKKIVDHKKKNPPKKKEPKFKPGTKAARQHMRTDNK